MAGNTGEAAAIPASVGTALDIRYALLPSVCVLRSNDGSQIVSIFGDGTIKLSNNLGEYKYTIRAGHHPSSYFSFTPTTGLCGGTVKVWNLTKSKLRCTLSGYRGYANNTVALSPDGFLCVTGNKDTLAVLWKRHDEKRKQYSFYDGAIVLALAHQNPNTYWLCAAVRESVTIWDLNTESIIWDLRSAAPFPVCKNKRKKAIVTGTTRPGKKIKISDLDRLLLEHVLRCLSYRDSLRFGSVCRWWRTVQRERIYPPTQFPLLLLPNQSKDSKTRTFYSLSDGISFEINMPLKAQRTYHCASYRGWWFMVDRDNREHLFLFNLYSGGQVDLPQIRFYALFDAYVSSDPGDPECIVAIPMHPDCRLMLCRVGVGDSEWTEYTGDFSAIHSMASCRGQLYCLDIKRNLMTLDLGGSSTTMRLVPMDNSELPLGVTQHLKKMGVTDQLLLVESCGELLMVFVPWESHSLVQVFRADLSKMAWVKVKSLGDRVLFMGRGCSTSLSAADIGGQGNHVYCTYMMKLRMKERNRRRFYCWYCLDLDLGSGKARHRTPPLLLPPDMILRGCSFWVAPNFLHGRIRGP